MAERTSHVGDGAFNVMGFGLASTFGAGIGFAYGGLMEQGWHYGQIAAWTDAEVAWVDENLDGSDGRVSRDEWVAQAKVLATGGETEFSRRVDKGEAPD